MKTKIKKKKKSAVKGANHVYGTIKSKDDSN